MMTSAEIADGAEVCLRDAGFNGGGILHVRERFAAANPGIVRRGCAVCEQARQNAIAHPAELQQCLVSIARLPDAVRARQMERADVTASADAAAQRETLLPYESRSIAAWRAICCLGNEDWNVLASSKISLDFARRRLCRKRPAI